MNREVDRRIDGNLTQSREDAKDRREILCDQPRFANDKLNHSE
jgi:hypothetical protein